MIGVFDSGAGGLLALCEMRKLSPRVDICFYADRENAPYGVKTKEELIGLVKRDVEILQNAGADKILMACCTASTVFGYLPSEIKKIATPIILPTARRAAQITDSGNIAVLATGATVASGAFTKALCRYKKCKRVYEFEAQNLVGIVEGGARDGNITDSELFEVERILRPIKNTDADTLILGCTHFPHIAGVISMCLDGMKIVSSAYEGAFEILKKQENNGEGKTVFL